MNDDTRCDPRFDDVATGRVGAKHSSNDSGIVGAKHLPPIGARCNELHTQMLRPYISRPTNPIRESLPPESVVSRTEHAVRVSLQRPVGVKHSSNESGIVGAKHSSNKFSSSVGIQSRMLRPYARNSNSTPSDQVIDRNLKEMGYGG